MKSIVIIIPYFGELPKLFPFWYSSAVNNPSVDFLFITDNDVSGAPNIHVERCHFSDFKKLIDERLGFDTSIKSPYKLCDFKPSYGYILQEKIASYDFWGFGDIDLIYGDIRSFLTDDILSAYDMISGWGHLTLYRNTESCNTMFMHRHEGYQYYKDSFTTDAITFFDEYLHLGMSDMWQNCYPERVFCQNTFIDDIRIPVLYDHFLSETDINRKGLTFIYRNKNLYRVYYDKKFVRHVEPTLYAHFQKRKNWKVSTSDTDSYIVYPNVISKPPKCFLYLYLLVYGCSKQMFINAIKYVCRIK